MKKNQHALWAFFERGKLFSSNLELFGIVRSCSELFGTVRNWPRNGPKAGPNQDWSCPRTGPELAPVRFGTGPELAHAAGPKELGPKWPKAAGPELAQSGRPRIVRNCSCRPQSGLELAQNWPTRQAQSGRPRIVRNCSCWPQSGLELEANFYKTERKISSYLLLEKISNPLWACFLQRASFFDNEKTVSTNCS